MEGLAVAGGSFPPAFTCKFTSLQPQWSPGNHCLIREIDFILEPGARLSAAAPAPPSLSSATAQPRSFCANVKGEETASGNQQQRRLLPAARRGPHLCTPDRQLRRSKLQLLASASAGSRRASLFKEAVCLHHKFGLLA